MKRASCWEQVLIKNFLAETRIALVGISRDRRSIGHALLLEFMKRGIDSLLVNPNTKQLFGQRSYGRVQEIEPKLSAALLLTAPEATRLVVRDCAKAGIKTVWMYRGGGQGAVDAEALDYCRVHGIHVIVGRCPLMYLQPVGGIHRCHQVVSEFLSKWS